jgi:DNA polymerase elongation subunit (family B)
MIGFKDAKYSIMTVTKILDNIYSVKIKIKDIEFNFTDHLDIETKIITRIFTDGTIQNSNGWFFKNIDKIKTLSVLKNECDKMKSNPLEYKEPQFKQIALDIETWKDINNTLHIMSIGIYSESLNLNKFFFIKDYDSEISLIKEVLNLLTKFNGYNIYIHNGARFDLIFLVKYIVDLKEELKLNFYFIYKDGELLQISIHKDSNKIVIMDSFKLLLTGLDKLAKVFDLDSGKFIFPHGFSNPDNFNYEGQLPDHSYFKIDNKMLITKEKYDNWFNSQSIWNFRKELEKYNLQDCKVLYKVLNIFFNLILENFN